MLIKELYQNSELFATIIIFQKWFKFQADICNGCDDVFMISINLNDIFYFKYLWCSFCVINGISKSDVVDLLGNANLSEKSVT